MNSANFNNSSPIDLFSLNVGIESNSSVLSSFPKNSLNIVPVKMESDNISHKREYLRLIAYNIAFDPFCYGPKFDYLFPQFNVNPESGEEIYNFITNILPEKGNKIFFDRMGIKNKANIGPYFIYNPEGEIMGIAGFSVREINNEGKITICERGIQLYEKFRGLGYSVPISKFLEQNILDNKEAFAPQSEIRGYYYTQGKGYAIASSHRKKNLNYEAKQEIPVTGDKNGAVYKVTYIEEFLNNNKTLNK